MQSSGMSGRVFSLSWIEDREIQEDKESFPPPRPWFVYLSSFPCFELCFFFLKRGKKEK